MASLDELRADLLRRLAKFLPMEESSAAATSSLSTTSSTKRTAAAPLAPIATTTPKLVSDLVLGKQMDELSGSIDASLAEIAHLQEGMERRRDSLARQMDVTAEAVARISGVRAQQAPNIASPMTPSKCMAPGVSLNINVAGTQIPAAVAESTHGVVTAALAAPLLLTDMIVATGVPEMVLHLGAPKMFEEIPTKTSSVAVATKALVPGSSLCLHHRLTSNIHALRGTTSYVPETSRLPGKHGPVHVVTCVFSPGKEGRDVAHCMLAELRPWSRNGFSPGFHVQPHLGKMPPWMHRGFSPAVFSFIFIIESRVLISKFWIQGALAKFSVVVNTAQFFGDIQSGGKSGLSAHYPCKVRHVFSGGLALYKCIFSVAKVAVYILLNLTLGKVVCMIQKSFSLAVSPVDMFKKICKGSVCMVVVEFTADKQHSFGENFQSTVQFHGHLMLGCPCLIIVRLDCTSQHMVAVMEVFAYLCPVEVHATYRSAHIFLVDFSLVVESTAATESKELFQCVNWQYQIGHRDSFLQERMVHSSIKSWLGMLFPHVQLCNMSTLDGLPWDPGGVTVYLNWTLVTLNRRISWNDACGFTGDQGSISSSTCLGTSKFSSGGRCNTYRCSCVWLIVI